MTIDNINFFSNKMFYLLLFVILFPVVSADCPVGTIEYPFTPPSKCYSFMTTKASFSSAEASCNKAGGSLTSIHDAFTNTFIREEASLLFRDIDASDFWIGASRTSSNSTWTWTDKSFFDFSDWKSGTNGQNYATMNTVNGMWMTADGQTQKPFVCASNSILPSVAPTTTPVSSCPDDWYFFADTNSCYFSTDLLTWDKAEEYCQSQGGHLASLHSSAERNFGLSVYHGSLWIGLYTDEINITRHTTWKWTDGSEVNYLPWYFPYFIDDSPSCIQLSGTSKYPVFINVNCTDKYYGLCKKPAATAPLPTTTPATTTPQTDIPCLSGWKYFEKTNSCYTWIKELISWPQAEQYCIYMDSHLASIHSQEELGYGGSANWVGLYSDNEAISWKWIDDTPFDYRIWSVNNPTRGGNPCGIFYNGGFANDQRCFTDTNYFLCKRAAFKSLV